MKHFYILAIVFILATLNSCTADEIETEKIQKVEAHADVDPNNPGSIIPPKKN